MYFRSDILVLTITFKVKIKRTCKVGGSTSLSKALHLESRGVVDNIGKL